MSEPATIADTLVAAAGTSRGVRVIEHDGRTDSFSYERLLQDALRIAAGLRDARLDEGARVALVLPDVGSFIKAFFGISLAGLVPIPLVPPAQAGDVATFRRQVRHLLAASRASAVITVDEIVPLLASGNQPGDERAAMPAVITFPSLVDASPLARPVEVSTGAIALIQFTSGSTAAPKGVVLPHSSIFANVAAISHGLSLKPTDIGVSWLPLYHDMGLIGMLLTSVYTRADTVVMSPLHFLKRPTAWLDAISRYRASVSFAPNFAYDLCLRRVKPSQIDALDLSSWRVAGCGAEPVRVDTLRAFVDRFGRTGFRTSAFLPSYGLAEHSLAVTFATNGLTVDRVDARRLVRESRAMPADSAESTQVVTLVGCGRPFPDHAVQIVDDDGHGLPERSVGRIVARGPSVMAGYFENPEATAEMLHDGWLHTGDIGYIAGGDLFVCGRSKDLIIRHGRKYHPPDLESAIAAADGWRPSAVVVFGINHVEEADEVVAVIEARASSAPDDVVDHVRRRVRETAGLELDRVLVAPPGTIPRTTSGKVRRAETRERFQAGTLMPAGRGTEVDGSL